MGYFNSYFNSIVFISSFLTILQFISCNESKPSEGFKLEGTPLVVEGMTGHTQSSLLIFGDCISKKIHIYSLEGRLIRTIDTEKFGVLSLFGSKVNSSGQILWVVGNCKVSADNKPCLLEIDLNNGELKELYLSNEFAHTFNDITLTKDEQVFITDHVSGGLYTLNKSKDSVEKFLFGDQLKNANGICSDGVDLFVSTSNGFLKVNPSTKKVMKLSFTDFRIAGIDGLYYYENSLIGIQNVFYPLAISRFFLNQERTKIDSAKILHIDPNSKEIPTTGAIIAHKLWFMKNTNITALNFENGRVIDSIKLKPIEVHRINLR